MQIDKEKFSPEGKNLLSLLLSPSWPEAVPSFLICDDTEEDKFERASGIIDFLRFDIEGKKVCDLGCGEGHLAIEASKKASLSIGYDLVKSGIHEWENQEKTLLTTNLDLATEKGPFDYIILYDVIDHHHDPNAVLQAALRLGSPQTELFIRCHPWMGRHGGHLYRELNKAFAHLVFTPQEIEWMGIKQEFCNKYYLPVLTHEAWFRACKMKKITEEIVKTPVEQFFRRPEIMARLPLQAFGGQFPEWQMSQTFNDYYISLEDAY